MTPENKPSRAASTLKTLIRVGKALREPRPDPEDAQGASPASPTGLREAARRAADTLRADPRVQGATGRVSELRSRVGEQADQRLAELIAQNRAGRGQTPPHEVTALLEQRRQERDAKLAQTRARHALLEQGHTLEQRRVLHLVASATPWAGGEATPLRYTELLDRLAPSGHARDEMAIHRALWTLAERRVLAVSPHGVITAIRTLGPGQHELPGD